VLPVSKFDALRGQAFDGERVRLGLANYKALDGLLHNQLAAAYLQGEIPRAYFTLATNLPVASHSDLHPARAAMQSPRG